VTAVRRSLAVGLAVLAAVAAGCGGGNDDKGTGATAEGCTAVDAPEPRDDGGATEPTGKLDEGTTYRLVLTTNCGAFTVTLDQASAPATAASLVALARDGFYDDTTIHRISPGFVIQGGDPTGTGSGGPGYSTVDPPPADAVYTRGTFAMAKTEVEAPGTAGSQWFVVTADDVQLPPDYAIAGRVTDGLDVVDRIGRLPSVAEKPDDPVVVSTVTVSES
jgi:cyclophilin family peptidyl-prolyl cis-trans isomerase